MWVCGRRDQPRHRVFRHLEQCLGWLREGVKCGVHAGSEVETYVSVNLLINDQSQNTFSGT